MDILEEKGMRIFLAQTVCKNGNKISTIEVNLGSVFEAGIPVKEYLWWESATNADDIVRYKTKEDAFKGHKELVEANGGPKGEAHVGMD